MVEALCLIYMYGTSVEFLVHHKEGSVGLTVALKVVKEPLVCMDLRFGGMDESTRQTIETHWPLLSESPTNTSLLPLSLSSNAVALNLVNMKNIQQDSKNINNLIIITSKCMK